MRTDNIRLLVERTGETLEVWNERVRAMEFANEHSLRAWLDSQGIGGYPQSLLVMERFGYPEFLLASADELIDGQYVDRLALRPILDAVLGLAPTVGDGPDAVAVQVRKTIVTLVTPRRQFAVIKPTTRTRVDLALRLDALTAADIAADTLLVPAKGIGNDTLNARIALTDVDDVDDRVREWLREAWTQNT